VEIVGLEPRRSDLARGIVIARGSRPLDIAAQRAIWEALGAAGVTEPGPDEDDEDDDGRARQWLAAPWLPPAANEVDAQRAAFEQEMTAAGIDWRLQLYGGVGHSFTNPSIDARNLKGFFYHADTDRRSWNAMVELFNETLV